MSRPTLDSVVRPCGALLAALLTVGGAAIAAPRDPGPRPLSGAERRGLELALAYLAGDADAWWEALADPSPLRALGREAALAEIAVRCGPRDGARWQLAAVPPARAHDTAVFEVEYPSGVAETLYLELVEADGGWRLAGLRTMAEVESLEPVEEPVPAPEGAAAAGGGGEPGRGWPVATLVLLATAAAGAVWLLRRQRSPSARAVPAAAAAALVLIAGSVALRLARRPPAAPGPPATVAAERGPLRLAALSELRAAIAAGDADRVETAYGGLSATGPVAGVADFWRAAFALSALDLDRVETLLAGRDAEAHPVLANLLAARLHFLRGDEIPSVVAWERALKQGVHPDGVLMEGARALRLMGFEGPARRLVDAAVGAGTRRAEAYYLLAGLEVMDQRPYEAERQFLVAWKLEPIERNDVLTDPVLTSLLDPVGPIYALFRLDQAAEPKFVAPPAQPSDPLELPAGAEARLSGSQLDVRLPAARLLVRGGREVAPRGTPVDEAGAWRRAEERQALAELDGLADGVRAAGATLDPALLRKLELAVAGLERDRRWLRLVDLTDGLERTIERLPFGLLRSRALALRRLERSEEARDLLVRISLAASAGRRRDPETLYLLSDVMASLGRYESALALLRKADRLLPHPANFIRERELQIENDLAIEFYRHRTPHFEIRYPKGGGHVASLIGEVLEAERSRLRRWIPLVSDATTEVHLLSFQDFLESYAGGLELLGLFDGRIRLPLADIWSLHPFVVAILSHELAHAMISQHTRDRAPHWLHEGIAERVEMVATRVNPMSDYHRSGRLLAFPVLEKVLEGFPREFLVATAYDEAGWTVRYLEAVHGVGAIHRLLAAFAAGADTAGALSSALGVGVEEFDREMREWWLRRAPAVWTSEVKRYDYEEPLVRRTSGESPEIPESLRSKWWQRERQARLGPAPPPEASPPPPPRRRR